MQQFKIGDWVDYAGEFYRVHEEYNVKGNIFNTAEEAGCAYDKYVIDNNLEHTTNGLYTKDNA